MKKIIVFLIALALLSLAACGGSAEAEVEMEHVSGDLAVADLPKGWSLVTGTEMNGASEADFICHSEDYQLGDAYLQVTRDGRDVGSIEEVLASETPFGKYYGEAELQNGTWYISENAAACTIDGYSMLVRGYACDFESSEVRNILGSLGWAK
ncbi:MAG: hypothetical protein ACI4IW_01940 [Oscillospiraceae bacterium]